MELEGDKYAHRNDRVMHEPVVLIDSHSHVAVDQCSYNSEKCVY